MKVVIPLAGKGTRLRPHTHVTPKPLLRVGDKPVMSYILDDLRELGVNEAVVITGHLKEKVQEYMEREYPDFDAVYVEQKEQNGTADAVALAEPYAEDELLIIFVDTLFDADLSIVKRLPEDVAGVIWAKEVEDYQRFGVIVTDEQGNMRQIIEKPKEPVSKLANIGLYYIRDWKLLFEGIHHVMNTQPGPSGEFYLTDAFQYMVDQGAKIKTIAIEGWYDAGKPETLLQTNLHVLSTTRGRSPADGKNVTVHEPVHVAEGVELEDAEIGPNVTLSAGTTVRGSRLRDTIVGEKTVIERSDLSESLVGSNVVLRGVNGKVDVGDDSVLELGGSA
ncbi:MAG TPA: sugar phosphate nucleotidyltransferase [Longimicrobiaceae bacterium]|nr:sugar phosphate nucleotidyltransferase [Longimicrobiaceae bacterium]